jgi:hypothetical protein
VHWVWEAWGSQIDGPQDAPVAVLDHWQPAVVQASAVEYVQFIWPHSPAAAFHVHCGSLLHEADEV